MKTIFKTSIALLSTLAMIATNTSCTLEIGENGNDNELYDDQPGKNQENVYSPAGKVFIDSNEKYCTIYSFNNDNTFDDYTSRWMGSKANMDFAHNKGTYKQDGNSIELYKESGEFYDHAKLAVYNDVLCLVVNASGYDYTSKTAKEVMDEYLAKYAHD